MLWSGCEDAGNLAGRRRASGCERRMFAAPLCKNNSGCPAPRRRGCNAHGGAWAHGMRAQLCALPFPRGATVGVEWEGAEPTTLNHELQYIPVCFQLFN